MPVRDRVRILLYPKPLPAFANPNEPNVPAKLLFGRKATPAAMEARAIGFYS
jgi:penicillin-insensitive murein endopeptidase